MKEFKSKYKYRIKELIFRSGYKSYVPQYSRFGIFWHNWGAWTVVGKIVTKSFSSKIAAEDFISNEIEKEYKEWGSKVAEAKITKYEKEI